MDKNFLLVLIIMDGWGVNPDIKDNSITPEITPIISGFRQNYPYCILKPSGLAVGLPEGQMGNSEVGHLNIGAGRIVYQDFTRINIAIEDVTFFENQALIHAMEQTKKHKSKLHLIGLLSDGGVHSHIRHIFALVDMAKKLGVPELKLHALLDGRDTPPTSGIGYVADLEKHMRQTGLGQIATVMGRFWGMDRDKRWDRVEQAYAAMVLGRGRQSADAAAAVQYAYDNGETDEFVSPTVIASQTGESNGRIEHNDAVIFFNFRADRAREITRALTDKEFSDFNRETQPNLSDYVCMTEYDETFDLPIAFPQEMIHNTLGETFSKKGLTQLRIAETEKYAHVTYFFNGGEEHKFAGEDRCLIPSPRDVKTYDEKPQMSAYEVTEEVLKRIHSRKYNLVVLNYANGDMVGHTGIMEAAIRAIKVVDECVGRVVDATLAEGGVALITSDHGNVEKMREDGSDKPYTAHSVFPVPFHLISAKYKDVKLRSEGILADIAPTILDLVNIVTPREMTGKSLILHK